MPLDQNLAAGAEAMEMALACTPHGSNNKGPGGPDIGATRAFRNAIRDEAQAKFETGTVPMLSLIMRTSAAARALGNGNCTELACIAFSYLYQKGVRPLDLMRFTAARYDHMWLVIGRAPDATPQMGTWGPDAVWCDPWAAPGGLNFSVAGLLNGTTLIVNHNFHYAMQGHGALGQESIGEVRHFLQQGAPTPIYRTRAG